MPRAWGRGRPGDPECVNRCLLEAYTPAAGGFEQGVLWLRGDGRPQREQSGVTAARGRRLAPDAGLAGQRPDSREASENASVGFSEQLDVEITHPGFNGNPGQPTPWTCAPLIMFKCSRMKRLPSRLGSVGMSLPFSSAARGSGERSLGAELRPQQHLASTLHVSSPFPRRPGARRQPSGGYAGDPKRDHLTGALSPSPWLPGVMAQERSS